MVPLPVNKTVTIGRSETCDLIVQVNFEVVAYYLIFICKFKNTMKI